MNKFVPTFAAVVMLAAQLLAAATAAAEIKLWSTVESRVIIGFNASGEALQARMPEGWTAITLPQGPLAGTNLLLVLMDRQLIRLPDGRPQSPSANAAVALMSYAVNPDVPGMRAFITRVYESAPLVNPYDNSVPAQITRDSGKTVLPANIVTRSESWSLVPEGGGMLSFRVTYTGGTLGWTENGESRPYSAVHPESFHIYRYNQLAEMAMNTNLGRTLPGEFAFTSDIPELADLFDGSEDLVAIVNIPVYIRDVYEP